MTAKRAVKIKIQLPYPCYSTPILQGYRIRMFPPYLNDIIVDAESLDDAVGDGHLWGGRRALQGDVIEAGIRYSKGEVLGGYGAGPPRYRSEIYQDVWGYGGGWGGGTVPRNQTQESQTTYRREGESDGGGNAEKRPHRCVRRGGGSDFCPRTTQPL